MNQEPDTNKIGRAFTWLSWIIALGLVAFLFDELLSQQYNPNQSVESNYSSRGQVSVKLLQNRYGHYVLNGQINQQPVTFLLDTGATSVSIPAHIADQLYLEPQGSYMVNTANGRIKVYRTTLSTLSIGEITLYNVAANINPGMDSEEILLGMSALKQVEFSQTGNQLIIREQR